MFICLLVSASTLSQEVSYACKHSIDLLITSMSTRAFARLVSE
jgi:hypothetical protein